jgi:NAD(P)-dependent dehydrogenase (short-subunit alcohol dehydrogenase family)
VSDLGTVIVTGGASGLGRAVADAVEAEGGRPVVLDVNPPQNGIAHRVVDLADTRSAEAAVREVAEEHGALHAVVTAAGIDACGRIDEVQGADWERVVAVNLLGTAAVVRAALPYLERAGGRVVTVASTLGLRALSDATAYCDGRDEQYKPPPDANLAPPERVAETVIFALTRPAGVEMRELVVCPSTEPSWP